MYPLRIEGGVPFPDQLNRNKRDQLVRTFRYAVFSILIILGFPCQRPDDVSRNLELRVTRALYRNNISLRIVKEIRWQRLWLQFHLRRWRRLQILLFCVVIDGKGHRVL